MMEEIAYVFLVDMNLVIFRDGMDMDEVHLGWGNPAWRISQFGLKVLAEVFGLDFRRFRLEEKGWANPEPDFVIWRGGYEEWGCKCITGHVEGGTLELALSWGDGHRERLTYRGGFLIHWEEPGHGDGRRMAGYVVGRGKVKAE